MGEESNSVRGVNGRTWEMISYRGVKHRFVARTLSPSEFYEDFRHP